MAAIQKKAGLGRKRITMTKISKKSNLQVTFSKRRAGLFKKASELCTLCGVEIAIVVFSPAGKAFSFSHPSMDSIIERLEPKTCKTTTTTTTTTYNNNNNNNNMHDHLIDGNQINGFYIHELNMELTHVLNQLEAEKKFGESLDLIRKDGENRYWWRSAVSELGLHEVEQLKGAMEMLKKKCLDNNVTDISKCQFYTDVLQECRKAAPGSTDIAA
ncbi:hypothetical protein ACFE04_015487 [Oxalis oulophora]